jgi:hypothetical protein
MARPQASERRRASRGGDESGKGWDAAEIIRRIRSLFKKGAPNRELVDSNEIINEMVALLRNEAMRYTISIRTELGPDLPQVLVDRVQLATSSHEPLAERH